MTSTLGSAPGIIVGVGVGTAASTALEPVVEVAKQTGWANNPHKVLDAARLAALVATGAVSAGTAAAEAERTGFDGPHFDAMVYLAQTAPGMSEALNLWRRGEITDAQWTHALVKAGLDPQYYPGLNALKDSRLDPAVIANAIQRGIIKDPGFLPVAPPVSGGKVPSFPVSTIDALTEAAAAGINEQRLFVETAIVGRPASPDLAARMTYRGIIDETDFNRAIAEGDTRNEWAAPLFDGFREIPTAHDYVELRLRGWITDAQMYAGTALHGMSQEDTDRLFLVGGRPMSAHAVFIALRRGGTYDGPTDMIAAPFLKSLQESNIRPEWYNLEWFARESYPSAFVVKALATGGDLTAAQTTEVLMNIGWPEWLIAIVVAKWVPAVATTATHAKSAVTTAITTLRKAYTAGQASVAQATQFLSQLGIGPSEITSLLQTWDVQRQIESLPPAAG